MPLGNLIRLIPLTLAEVPSHPSISTYLNASKHKKHDSQSSSSFPQPQPTSSDPSSPNPNLDSNSQPLLIPFIREVLSEAVNFVDREIPETFTKKGSKGSAPASAKVELSERMLGSEEISRIERPGRAKGVEGYGEAWWVNGVFFFLYFSSIFLSFR